MTITVTDITNGVISLSDGTRFRLASSAILDYGIAAGDQVVKSEKLGTVTIFRTLRHKAEIKLVPNGNDLPTGTVLCGASSKAAYDPANPFAGKHAVL
jgi:hypothetical protein